MWSHSGNELFFLDGSSQMVAVPIAAKGAAFAWGEQEVLFSARSYLRSLASRLYDVTPDDQQFIMVRFRGDEATRELVVVENFFEELKAKLGN